MVPGTERRRAERAARAGPHTSARQEAETPTTPGQNALRWAVGGHCVLTRNGGQMEGQSREVRALGSWAPLGRRRGREGAGRPGHQPAWPALPRRTGQRAVEGGGSGSGASLYFLGQERRNQAKRCGTAKRPEPDADAETGQSPGMPTGQEVGHARAGEGPRAGPGRVAVLAASAEQALEHQPVCWSS